MTNRVVFAVARSDGRASFRPFKNWKGHIGEHVQVADKWLPVSRDGRVHIPRAFMDAFGTLNPDGRRTIGTQIGARSESDGAHRVGARLITPTKEQAASLRTGEYVPDDDFRRPDTRVQEPSDSVDYYYN